MIGARWTKRLRVVHSVQMRALCFAAIALAFAAGPATARAASAGVARNVLTFEAGPGEANQVTVSTGPGVFRISDPGSMIGAGLGCRVLTAHMVECERGRVERVILRLLDGNDSATVSVGVSTRMNGGEGDDVLEGSEVDDLLRGGPGADQLFGSDGFDTLDGGTGPDVMSGGTEALVRDIPLEFDFVSYSGRTTGVRVTIDGIADDGEPGEGDNVLPDVEVVLGGRGDDVLIGNDAFVNALAGLGGNDILVGGGGEIDILFGDRGNDDLIGGPGVDILDGGRGNDRLRGGAGEDELTGGPGRDVLAGGSGSDDFKARDREGDAVLGGPGSDYAVVDGRRLDFVLGVEEVARPGAPRAQSPLTGRIAERARAGLRRALG